MVPRRSWRRIVPRRPGVFSVWWNGRVTLTWRSSCIRTSTSEKVQVTLTWGPVVPLIVLPVFRRLTLRGKPILISFVTRWVIARGWFRLLPRCQTPFRWRLNPSRAPRPTLTFCYGRVILIPFVVTFNRRLIVPGPVIRLILLLLRF